MIIKFIKFILSVVFFILSILTVVAVYLRIILLNPYFYNLTLKQNNFYENLSRGLKSLASDYLKDQVSLNYGKEYTDMTVGERQQVESEIQSYTAFINKDSLQLVIDGNLNNILAFLNNQSADLYLYLPIDNLGFNEEVANNLKPYFVNNKLSVKELLLINNANETELKTYEDLKYTAKYLNITLPSLFFCLFLIAFIYALFSKKGKKYQSAGILLTIDGILILITSWIFFTAQNIFSQGINYKTQTAEVIAGVLVPFLLKPLAIIFIFFGLFLLFIGIILYNKKEKISL